MQKADLYHFKVMKLQTHEDTGKLSECRLKFHFMFECIKQKAREDFEIFEGDISSNPVQRIYLSRDTTRLMEVINDFIATVYERSNVDDISGMSIATSKSISNIAEADEEDDHGQQVTWKVLYTIPSFPKVLAENTSCIYFFSPDFNYMLDFKYQS